MQPNNRERLETWVPLAPLIGVTLLCLGFHCFDAVLCELSTQRAVGFSEERFAVVTPGAAIDQVKEKLGQPLKVTVEQERQYWKYTLPKEPIEGWGHWSLRWLVVTNGFVAEVRSREQNNH